MVFLVCIGMLQQVGGSGCNGLNEDSCKAHPACEWIYGAGGPFDMSWSCHDVVTADTIGVAETLGCTIL